MILKISVLLASIAQVIAPVYLSIGTFEDAPRALPVFIQPASWAFSIWGLIYTLSFIYAVYQMIPQYENDLLRTTRIPALLGFLGSIVWLYFAGMNTSLVWLTVVILFLMAIVFTFVVRAQETKDRWQNIFSKYILLPYAAWTGIACWINMQALLVEENVVTASMVNVYINALLFVGIVFFTLYYFRKSAYNIWYGGVIVWAGSAVVAANIQYGNMFFASLAGLFVIMTIGLFLHNRLI